MALLGPPLAAVENLNLAGNPPQSATQIYSSTDETTMDTPITEASKLRYGQTPMGLTENMSLTFLSSGNPCLDFFFHIVPDTPPSDLIQRLQLAWVYDPLVTLKLIFNLRGVRGTGKSDKEGFYTAALWLHDHHPETLARNVGALADFGYLKDLPEILYRLHEGLDVRRNARENWKKRRRGRKSSRRAKKNSRKFKQEGDKEPEASDEEKDGVFGVLGVLETVEVGCSGVDKETARKLRKEREMNRARRALERYKNDPRYRFLYDCICDVFAELLKLDIQHLSSGHATKISLAAKWCPTIDSSYDKMTLICEGIARRVFPRDCDPEYEKLEEAHYAILMKFSRKSNYM